MGSFFSLDSNERHEHPLLQPMYKPLNVIPDYFTSEITGPNDDQERDMIKTEWCKEDYTFVSNIKENVVKVADRSGRFFVSKVVGHSKTASNGYPIEFVVSACIGDNPHCVQVTECRRYGQKLYVLAPWAKYGPLRSDIKGNTPNLTVNGTIELLYDIGRALMHMHSVNVVHRDVKPDNIVVSDEGYMLCDYDVSQILTSPDEMIRDKKGTAGFMAKEVLSQSYKPKPADMFSLGATAFSLLYGALPFNETQTLVNGQENKKREVVFPAIPYIHDELKKIITSLLSDEPGERLTAVQLVQNPWLSERAESWKKLRQSILSTPGLLKSNAHST